MDYKVPRGAAIEEWEARLPLPQRDIVRGLRTAARMTIPRTCELVNRGHPWYEGIGHIAAITLA